MLAKRAAKLDKVYGVLPWMEIFTLVLGFITAKCRPPTPAPVNPTPTPTPAQAKAWDDAWLLKSNALASREDDGSYSGKHFNRLRAEIKRKHKRDGTKISKDEAADAAAGVFEDAIASSMPDLYHDVLEARS